MARETRERGVGGGVRPPGPLTVLLIALALFSTGVGTRPGGVLVGLVYDLLLYNVVFLAGAVAARRAAQRRPAERLAWRALGVALTVNAAGNASYTLLVAAGVEVPYPSVADLLWLAYYPLLYVAVLGLARSRVARFHASLWLDGLVGVLGAAAVTTAVVLAPALRLVEGDPAAVMTNLAYPVADVLLLALLAGVAGVLGMRVDRVVVLVALGLLGTLVGDVVYLNHAAAGTYVEGGPLDLTWLLGTAALAAAATASADPAPGAGSVSVETVTAEPGAARIGWRVLAVPFVCNAASLALLAAGWDGSMPAVACWCAVGCVLAALLRTAVTFGELRDLRDVHRQARSDELTGLPNRRGLLEAAESALVSATAEFPLAMLLIDLDGFKEVNDGLGHHAGDELLRQIGPRLSAVLRDSDRLARLGGDEFAVLLPGTALEDAERTAARLQAALDAPFEVEGVRLHVQMSVGVATAPVPAATVEELMRCADAAMYVAKRAGTGTGTYVPDGEASPGDRLRTMEDLRAALTGDGQLLVHLQPQVDVRDGRVVGAEALVRWQHPTRGLLSPAHVLPAAAQAGLLLPLADTVLDLALAAARRWWTDGLLVPVSVNLAAANVTDLDLPAKVAAALARHGLPPAALTLELVEDTLMDDPERARVVLGELRALGVATSIDDYGTGYSSLAYLRHLPADELKLDRAFLVDVPSDPRATAIVEHTIALAHALGLRLVAEGVETAEAEEALRSLGCDVAQGFGIARPLPVEEFLAWLQPHRAAAEAAALPT